MKSARLHRLYHEPLRIITTRVDMATTERLAQQASEYLATLSPERRAELEREWEGEL